MASIYAKVSPGVVFVSARGGNGRLSFNGQGGGRAASGSGFVIDDKGYIVTNDHVVEDANAFTVRFGDEGSKPIPAKLVGKDPSTDLAVLKIDPSDGLGRPQAGRARRLEGPRARRPAIAIGSPFGLVGHRDQRHHLGARPRDRVAERLHDLRRRPDRRRDQPRQLGRPAARRATAA